jgi:acetyl-CoA C-acetyltransferase
MTASTAVVICEPLRTPVGRMGGALAPLSATELATVALEELVRRTRLGEGDVDDVILGNGYANGESPAIGRVAALDAGLGTRVPGLQIDRRCGSGLQAVLYAAAQVATGAARLVVAGGAESMSNVEHYALGLRTGVKQGGIQLMDRLDRARETAGGTTHPVPGGMIETAENLRRAYGISREEQDQLAVRSHHRAVAAHQAGKFADELVPVTVPGKRGKPDTVIDRDEHPPGRRHRRGLQRAPPDPRQARSRVHRAPATPRGRTTAPRCASSPPTPRPTSAV